MLKSQRVEGDVLKDLFQTSSTWSGDTHSTHGAVLQYVCLE